MSRLTSVIPVFNGARHIAATLESLARQELRPDRVIIQDNGSTDNTREVVEPYVREHGFEWAPLDEPTGARENFNLALRFASETEYLHLIPHDDLVQPDFFERLIRELEPVSGCGLAYSAYSVVGDTGEPLTSSDLRCPHPIDATGTAVRISLQTFLRAQAEMHTICMPAVLMKTNRKSLPLEFSPGYIQSGDVVFYAQFAPHCKRIVEVRAPLCRYRRHLDSVTSKNQADPAVLLRDIWKGMEAVMDVQEEHGAGGWLWRHRQRCRLAAIARVMAGQTRADLPAGALVELYKAGREMTGPLHWVLGGLAVVLTGRGPGRLEME
ncbi:MAG: glycosyltransferase [Verrucomicrobiota bacterium]|nr:glycosyltransferase [Verrucomicrobiota bacterium]